MLGKRPRLLQRTDSRMQLPEGICREIEHHGSEKLRTDTVSPRIPCQIIGFNPVKRDAGDVAGSPRSVLPGAGNACSQVRSPRSAMASLFSNSKKGCEAVGLGIVVALDSSDQKAVDHSLKKKASVHDLSQPIPISASRLEPRVSLSSDVKDSNIMHRLSFVDMEMDRLGSIFSTASPSTSFTDGYGVIPLTDFLSVCYFCKRKIAPGRDIYMYRGDRAFCTMECRYQQIVIDERKERCSAAAPVASSGKANRRNTALNTKTAVAA